MMKRLSIALLLIFASTAMATADEPDVVLNESFDLPDGSLSTGWRADRPAWRVDAGSLVVDSLRGTTQILAGKPDWQNYEITATVTFDQIANDSRWVAIVFRAGEPGAAPWSHCAIRFRATAPKGTEFTVRADRKTWRVRKTAKLAEDCRLGQPRQLRIVVRGANVEAYVDGQRVLDSGLCLERETGRIGLAASGCVARFDDFRVRRLPSTPRLSEMPLKPCLVVGHRGFSAVAPENTVASARMAIDAGANGSECDVYESKDGVIVVMHDPMVDRTTNGEGKVAELTLAQLKKLDAGTWKNKKYAGEPIPTLDEILATHKNTGSTAVIEIKAPGIAQKVVETIRQANMLDQTVVIAFDGDAIRTVRTSEPRIPCAWLSADNLTGTPAERADWIAGRAKQYQTDKVDLLYTMLSAELIDELHRRGIVVWTWTVDEPIVIDALMRWGIDTITTNRPDVIVRALDTLPTHSRRRHR